MTDAELCILAGEPPEFLETIASLSIEELEARLLGLTLDQYRREQEIYGKREMACIAASEIQRIADA